jgi:hypothetical protein
MEAYPRLLPGHFSGGDWRISLCDPADSATSPVARQMQIPRVATIEDQLIRLHEMWHVRRDNLDPHKGQWGSDPHRRMFRAMVEECALDFDALGQGVDLRPCRDGMDFSTWTLPKEDYLLALEWLQLASSQGGTRNGLIVAAWTACHQELRAHPGLPDLLGCLKSLQGDCGYHNCDAWADKLAALFPPPGMQSKPQGKTPQQRQAEAQQAKEDAQQQAAQDKAQERRKAGDDGADTQISSDSVDGGIVQTHSHMLDGRVGPCLASSWQARDTGAYVRYPARLYPAGRVFGHRTRQAALIVDGSRSMHWTPADLERLLKIIPGLWCGVYSSHRNVGWNGTSPRIRTRLCIVAAKGRVSQDGSFVDSEIEHTGVNKGTGCDLPALDWTWKHAPHPLVWLSDGKVGPGYEPAVDRWLKAHKVVRVRGMEDAAEYLRGKAVLTFDGCSDRPAKRRRHGVY